MNKAFKILAIEGGGIRGIFPAKFLADLEEELSRNGAEQTNIYQHFDLICGTSTGGIIALGLSLGIPAKEIYELYKNNAAKIFSNKRGLLGQLRNAQYDRTELEELIRKKFRHPDGSRDYRLEDCKTAVCIPIYDLMQGKPSVLKSKYHEAFVCDYHIPAYQAALAASAAPTYFNPYSAMYTDLNGQLQVFNNKIDGGVFANNPTLLGIIEAQKAFHMNLKDLRVLSIGTGYQKFTDACARNRWGLLYWINRDRKRLIELFMQGQSQQVQNLVSLLQNGIDGRETENYVYNRIDAELDDTCKIEMDATDHKKLDILSEKAHTQFQNNASIIIKNFFS